MNRLQIKRTAPGVLLSAICGAMALFLSGCDKPPGPSLDVVLAPPGPTDLGPASGLSTAPEDAVVFDLNYRPRTGAATDLQYYSSWGYGGSSVPPESNSFTRDVGKRAARFHYVQNPSFKGREWAAVEYKGRQAMAFYFDLNADGKLDDDERFLPTHRDAAVSESSREDNRVEFITSDFMNPAEGGGEALCRTLLQVAFYGGSEPNCMWSPAAVMDGTATFNRRHARLLLYMDTPGGSFEKHGSSKYALLTDRGVNLDSGEYIPTETLSSLISFEGQFYHFLVEGRRSNGLPARVLLTKYTSHTGALALKLNGSESLETKVSSLSLQGVDDQKVFFRLNPGKTGVFLPVGAYKLSHGAVSYRSASSQEWGVSFTQGPRTTIKADEEAVLQLGRPLLEVRAVEERQRYNRSTAVATSFKRGTRIYLEPTIIGENKESFSRFRQSSASKKDKVDCPPKITITGPDGKQVLSKNMEYG
jgi:hypothetical protein